MHNRKSDPPRTAWIVRTTSRRSKGCMNKKNGPTAPVGPPADSQPLDYRHMKHMSLVGENRPEVAASALE